MLHESDVVLVNVYLTEEVADDGFQHIHGEELVDAVVPLTVHDGFLGAGLLTVNPSHHLLLHHERED